MMEMSDPAYFASAMAIAILLGFLVRFYRRQMAPHMKRERLPQIVAGLAVIVGSIAASIWLRMNS